MNFTIKIRKIKVFLQILGEILKNYDGLRKKLNLLEEKVKYVRGKLQKEG